MDALAYNDDKRKTAFLWDGPFGVAGLFWVPGALAWQTTAFHASRPMSADRAMALDWTFSALSF
jgi:hypothetical protein